MTAYKGYLICSTLHGETYIEKNKHHISWANNEAAARKVIDQLSYDCPRCKRLTVPLRPCAVCKEFKDAKTT